MDMSRKVDGGGPIVTACARESGAEFCCLVGTCIAAPDGTVVREFTHDRTFGTQHGAVPEGMKEGISGWICRHRTRLVLLVTPYLPACQPYAGQHWQPEGQATQQ
jgi:hypothetical protein